MSKGTPYVDPPPLVPPVHTAAKPPLPPPGDHVVVPAGFERETIDLIHSLKHFALGVDLIAPILTEDQARAEMNHLNTWVDTFIPTKSDALIAADYNALVNNAYHDPHHLQDAIDQLRVDFAHLGIHI